VTFWLTLRSERSISAIDFSMKLAKMPNKSEKLDNNMVLQVESLCAGYGKKEVLREVSLGIIEGEILALIGPNGAGKSTLLKVIAGTLKPSKGKIHFDGKELTDLLPHQRVQEGILYFLQGGQVFPSLTVRENLEMGGIGLKNQKQAMDEVLTLFPMLKDALKARTGLLSGGQRQMLALGTILMRKPKLLLLDEPSAGLAPNLVKEILEKISEINRLFGTTVLLVEQNVRCGLEISKRALVLVDGRIQMECQEPKELLNSGDLEKLFFSSVYSCENREETHKGRPSQRK